MGQKGVVGGDGVEQTYQRSISDQYLTQRRWGALECSEVLDMLEGIKYLNLSSHER